VEMQTSIEAWRRRWKRIQRLGRRKRKDPHLLAFWKFIISLSLAIFAEFAIFFSLLGAGQLGLLDTRTIVSVVVPEVGIGVFLYYFLGERHRGRLDEIVNLMDACAKLSHLRVFAYKWWVFDLSYVENTITRQAYKASAFVDKLSNEGIIEQIVCKNEKEMRRILRESKTKLNEREPTLAELLNPNAKSNVQ